MRDFAIPAMNFDRFHQPCLFRVLRPYSLGISESDPGPLHQKKLRHHDFSLKLLGVCYRPRTTVDHLFACPHIADNLLCKQIDLQPTRGYHSIMLIHDSLDTEAFSIYLLSTIVLILRAPGPLRAHCPLLQTPL